MKPHIYTFIEKEKYQVIITNPADVTLLDILPDRKQSHLISYFKKWNRDERSGVKFFVSDMLKPYAYLLHLIIHILTDLQKDATTKLKF